MLTRPIYGMLLKMVLQKFMITHVETRKAEEITEIHDRGMRR